LMAPPSLQTEPVPAQTKQRMGDSPMSTEM
jgi:hypothetical protein